MKIVDIRTTVARKPLARPLANATVRIEGLTILFLEVIGEDGIGESIGFTILAEQMPLVVASVELFRDLFVGSDVHAVTKAHAEGRRRLSFLGPSGAPIHALALIEAATQDLRAKSVGLSLASMLGRSRDAVPVYASQGLWTNQDIPALIDEADAFLAAGYRAMKLRLRGDPVFDLPRVEALRVHVGAPVQIMVDANQALSLREALGFAHDLREFDIAWFEEPFASHETQAFRLLTERSPIPVATGESLYNAFAFADLVRVRGADILMPDLQRVGGVGEFVAVCALAACHDLPVSSHLFPEMSLALMAHAPSAHSLEMVDWFADLYEERIELVHGAALAPDRPGWGFTVDRDRLLSLAL